MSVGIERPLILLAFLAAIALVFGWALTHKKRGSLFHPWAEHLKARIGSSSAYSRFPLILRTASAVCMALVLASPWIGFETRRVVESSRMIMLVIDASGSMLTMQGAPLDAAVASAQKLIEKRPDDRIGVTFFASEANYTAFGIPASYLTKEEVYRRARGLGGGTIVSHGLFMAFAAIAREDELLTGAEFGELYRRAQYTYEIREKQTRESKHERFVSYLNALFETKRFTKADRFVVLFSDCEFQYGDYDITSVMKTYQAFGIRVELVCIQSGSVDFEKKAAEYSDRHNDRLFLEGLQTTGGRVRYLHLAGNKRPEPAEVERELKSIIEEIDALKPREITYEQGTQERFLTRELFFASLLLLLLGEGLASSHRFRIHA